ncbi:hypothetical protein [Streptomyces sp. DH12]|uniref:hypothetical protein n=1 Tax=Streptomyces sp. DH12 TaxID=2857010 RepID=UPI001E62247F|nr:hypothetical protein [Streptomyces sp. DH12]
MAAVNARHAWDDLNDRQQIYLTVLYDADQALEEERRTLGAQGQWSSTPARVWRRINVNGVYSPVAASLRARGVYDSGAGATLAALADRGLIESGWVGGALCAWMTRAGRAAVRAGLGIAPLRPSRPRWALSEGMWRAMARVAAAGVEGLPIAELRNSAHLYLVTGQPVRGNRPYLTVVTTHARQEVRDWNLRPYDPPAYTTRTVRHYRLSEEGRAHYVDHLDAYRELYPDIDAPDTPPPAAS